MKAAVLERFGDPLILAELDLDAPGPNEIRIRVAASGVCHTDRTVQTGGRAVNLPLVLGHEAAGIVEEIGSAVTSVQPGDKVVTCAAASCGGCEWCLRGESQHCQNTQRARPAGYRPRLSRDGHAVAAFTGIGGFASEMLVHERAVAKVPDAMPLDRAALLGCAVHTGVGAVRYTAAVSVGQTVAVIGCGGVGLSAIQAARLSGASTIIAIDIQPSKLDRARLFGATHVIDGSANDPVEAVRELTGGGVDHAFEVVGRSQTIEQAFAMTRIRGTATAVGLARAGDLVKIPADELMLEKKLQGSKMGHRFFLDIPWYCNMYLEGRLMLDELISERIALKDVNSGLQALDASEGARSIIVFD